MVKRILLFTFVIVAYLLYARFVLNPQSLNNFSLIDDGQLTKYGYYLRECLVDHQCGSFKTNIIDVLPDVGLSRLGSWLIHGTLYQGSAVNAQFQHTLRAYGFGLAIVILFVLASLSARSNSIAITLGAALLTTNYSFSENMIRLGPIEPYMVIFLGIFSLLFLNVHSFSKNWKRPAILALAFALIYFLLIKEASIALLPTLFITGMLFQKLLNRKVLFKILIVSGGIYFVAKLLLRGADLNIDYASNYRLNFIYIFQNAQHFMRLLSNSLRPFFKLTLIIVPVIFISKRLRQKVADHHLVYWFLVFTSFTAVLFPWKFVLDRYLLPSIFSFSIFFTILLSRVMDEVEKMSIFNKKTKIFYRSFIVLILFNLFFRGASLNFARTINYRNWFIIFTQFEADQVRAIANNDDTVYINAIDAMNNWEVTYQIPLHLKYFYDGKPRVERLGEIFPDEGYLFTRTSLEPVISLEVLSKSQYPIVDSKEYYVSQIDSIAFRELFKLRPIQAFQNPPLSKEGISYYWEIRKL